MTNTSATGGYLQPTSPPAPPLEDQALDRFVQQVVVGVTGMPGSRVFPRWQPDPPNLPDGDWCGAGVLTRVGDTFASEIHVSDGDGHDLIHRQEILGCQASFYGSNAGALSSLFRDGLSVAQNREALQRAAFGLVEVGEAVDAPQLTKEKWLRRVDVGFRLRREVLRSYPVLNLLQGQVVLDCGVDTHQMLIPETVP